MATSPLPCPDAAAALQGLLGPTRTYRRAALVVVAGAPARTVFFVRSGQVRLYQLAGGGDEIREVTTAVLGPGQLFGVSALLGREAYHSFAEALTPVEAWAVPAARLRARLLEEPPLLGAVLAALGRRTALNAALLRDVTLLPVARRIPDVLKNLGPCLGGETLRLSNEQLAALVGARRETVSRAGSHAPAAARRSVA